MKALSSSNCFTKMIIRVLYSQLNPVFMQNIRYLSGIFVILFFFAACETPVQDDHKLSDNRFSQSDTAERASAQGDLPEIPAGVINQTMYQFFYWDSYPELWSNLTDPNTSVHQIANEIIEAGVTSVWLPPAAKGMGGQNSVGYDVYDMWDLGEFNQKGTVPTRYGTKSELESAIGFFNQHGVDSYYDVVFNHRMGADEQEYVEGYGDAWTVFYLDGRDQYYTDANWGALYHDFEWDWTAFNGKEGELFPGKSWGNTFHFPYLMGNDVDYNRQSVSHESKAWGEWIVNDINFGGFRMDAIAHVDLDFTRDWINHVQAATSEDVFFVAEAWVENVDDYLDAVGTDYLYAFDFTLRDDFVALSDGSKDMRWWGGLANSSHAARAVTFVDNHDTSREGNPYNMPEVIHFKNQAYAYILMREHGVPTVFARDWDEFGMSSTLSTLVEARRYFAYGPGHESGENTEEVYAYVREGLSDVPGTGMVMLISGRDSGGEQSHWINSRQPDTEFYDYAGNRSGTVTTDSNGYGSFPVNLTEGTGWSVWVPVSSGSGGDEITLRMTVDAGYGNSVYFTGNTSELTNWGGGVEGTWTENNVWEVTISDPGEFEWKTRLGPSGATGELWEQGSNHNQLNLHPAHQGWE
jgi:alpha-amylase